MRTRIFASLSLRVFESWSLPVGIIFILLLTAGCAKIAEPQPPEVRIPRPATDLAARQLSDFVVLTFSKPDRNTNGSEATLERVDILRLEGKAVNDGPVPDKVFLQDAVRISTTPSSRFSEHLSDHTFVFQDKSLTGKPEMYSNTYRYAVLFVNKKNQSAGLSNQARITPIPIPPPPTGLAANGAQDWIRLTWQEPQENMDGSRPPRITGYNIYRSEEPHKFPSAPLNPEPVQSLDFVDRNFRFDTTYYYAVTVLGDAKAESQLSEALRFDTRDVYPPFPPQNFSAILHDSVVILLWEPSPSTDVAGYRVYRKEKGTETRRLLQPELIKSLSFRDSGIEAGKEYEYEIQAVDTHGNEGAPVRAEIEKR